MADAGSHDEPGGRGRLVVADRVVERIATIAAREVPGVTPAGSALGRAVGRRYPKADAQVAGDRVRITVEVAVAWPASLVDVTAGVRDIVRSRLGELAGLQVDTVDVIAAKVVHEDAPTRRRVQ